MSYDLNYRALLWKNRGGLAKAQEVMNELCKYVDVLVGNEEELQKALGIEGADVSFKRTNGRTLARAIGQSINQSINQCATSYLPPSLSLVAAVAVLTRCCPPPLRCWVCVYALLVGRETLEVGPRCLLRHD